MNGRDALALNPAAYAVPGTNIGRYPTSAVGAINGPGTEALSLSLTKSVTLREGLRLQLGGQAANFLNHPNYAPPNTTFNTAAFGTITALQSAEGAGPRILRNEKGTESCVLQTEQHC